MYRIPVNSVNNVATFDVKNSVSALSVQFHDANAVVYADRLISNVDVKVELIRKNQPTVILIDGNYLEYSKVIQCLFDGKVVQEKALIVLGVGGNLKLDNETFVRITFDWKNSADEITEIRVEEISVVGETVTPFVMKKVLLDSETVVDTEFYKYVMFSPSFQKLESTVNTIQDNQVKPNKIVIDRQYLKLTNGNSWFAINDDNWLKYESSEEQKLKVYSEKVQDKEIKLYLIQL